MTFFKNFFAVIGVLFSILIITTAIAYVVESINNTNNYNETTINLGVIKYGYNDGYRLFYIGFGDNEY